MKNNLKIAAYINFIMAFIYILTSSVAIIPMIFVLFAGFYLLDAVNNDELEIKRSKIVLIGFISLIFNPISAIIILFNINKIDKVKVKKPVIDKETRRIDIILKLGVFMVLMSGLLFATSSWSAISDITKFIGLIILSMLFFGLSKFSQEKLKMESTTHMYWYLSMSFILFALLSVFYYELLGSYLSFDGDGFRLVYSSLFLTVGILSYLTNLRFKKPEIKTITYTALYMALDSALMHFTTLEVRLLALTTVTGLLYVYAKKDKHLSLILHIIMSVIIPVIYLINISSASNIYLYAAVLIPILTNILYIGINEKYKLTDVSIPIIIGVLLNNLILLFDNVFIPNSLLLITLFASIYIISLFVKYKDSLRKNMLIMANFFMFTSIIFMNTETVINVELLTLVMAGIFLITDLLLITFKKNITKIDKLIQPIKVIIFTVALYNYAVSVFSFENPDLLIDFVYIVLFLMFLASKEVFSKNIYRFFLYTVLFMSSIAYSFSFLNTTSMIILILITGLQFIYSYLYEKDKKYLSISYTLFLIALFSQIVVGDIFRLSYTFSSLIVLNMFLVMMIIFRKNKNLFTITTLAVVLPINVLISEVIQEGDLNIMLTRLLAIYIIFVFNKLIFKDQSKKEIFTLISLSIVVLSLIFTNSLLIGLFVGLMGILIMMLGYYNKEYSKLFILGIATTVINIIYQLIDLWNKIPFWLYLLVVGLLLIAFVTKKELKRLDNKGK
jgi:hypothetical protein